ncbi:fungal-specific transcription factor domain-containing protein [Xylariaceae sp. FL0016]|nr:fungal-specific transcription factor domain-containing protein [Xylariaceae sp. FL0016]
MNTPIASEASRGGRTYRARKQRPCDACRKRKICCVRDSDAAPCSLCQMRAQPCTYFSQPNVRRRRVNTSVSPPADIVGTLSLEESTVTHEPSVIVSRGSTTKPEAHSGRRMAAEEWVSQFVGLSGDQDPYVLRHCEFSENRYRRPDWACLRVKGGENTPTHFTIVPDTHLDARPAYYPSHPPIDLESGRHRRLMDAFFSTVHTSFPIIDPRVFMDTTKEVDPPLLGAVYSLARTFSPQPAMTSHQASEWRQFLHQAFPMEARHPRLETIEAGLCFLQRHTEIHRAPTTPGLWSEIGSLVGMAHELGLNVDPSEWQISQTQRSRRIRIAWTLFIFDKWAALGLGRPSYISRDDWSVPVASEGDLPESDPSHQWDTPASSRLLFVAMTKLTLILAELLQKFYTIKAMSAMRSKDPEDLLRIVKHFEEHLHLFFDEYFVPLRILTNEESILDSTGTVELAYHTLQVVLYRAVLRHLPLEHAAQVRQSARAALLAATSFLSSLQVARLRAFWWSPISRINFAIVGSFMFSMLLSSTDDTEIEFWTVQIDRYRRLLDMQSITFDTTKLAVKRLELLSCVTSGPGEEGLFCQEPWDLCIQ